jgi:predicted CXXCH cytochrome family protein
MIRRNICRILKLALSSLTLIAALSLLSLADECIDCHKELELKAPVEGFQTDVHREYGLNCASCHGGNPDTEDIEAAKDKTFKGAPSREKIPEFCGVCHSDSLFMRRYNPRIRVDQLVLYWTSQHGKLLKNGDRKVAVCTDCHGVHGILQASQPKATTFPWNIPDTCGQCHADSKYMEGYRIPVSQVSDYKESVHAHALYVKKDLSAPVCNDCHGNHGASPPEVSSIAYVCRQCHPSASELFSQSPHKVPFDELEIPECEACHGNHKILPPSDEMLGTGEGGVCIECHDRGSAAYETASTVEQKLASFKAKMKDAENKLDRADKQGVEVSEARYRLQGAHTDLIQARNLIHGLALDPIKEKIEDGELVVGEVAEAGDAALREAVFRRRGLVIATIFIFLLALALLLKIKQIEKKNSRKLR